MRHPASILSDHLKMIAQRTYQPNELACLPAACALAIGVSITSFMERLEDVEPFTKIDETLPAPHCYRGYAYQDCAIACLRLGWAPTLFDSQTLEVREGGGEHFEFMANHPAYLSNRCVITYQAWQQAHSVAVHGNMLYDPASGVYEFNPHADNFPFPILYSVVFTRIKDPSTYAFRRIDNAGPETESLSVNANGV